MNPSDLTFFHAPNTRSGGTLALLEELGADYRMHVLNWTTMFKMVPELPVIRAYIERVLARPAMRRAAEKDAELAAAQAA